MIQVHGEGRCTECFFHVPTQGHRDCCSRTAPIEPPSTATDDFIENMRRRKAELEIPAEVWEYFSHTPPEGAKRQAPKREPRSSGPVAQPGRNPAYVTAAIRTELEKLAEAQDGSRNDTLNRVAFSIFGFVKGGHADEQAARTELRRIASVIGLSHSEIHATLRSAWNSATPRDVPATRGGA